MIVCVNKLCKNGKDECVDLLKRCLDVWMCRKNRINWVEVTDDLQMISIPWN